MESVTKSGLSFLQKKTVVILLLLLVVFTNIPPGYSIFLQWFDYDLYKYSNCDGSVTFQEIPFKDRNFDIAKDTYYTYNDSLNRTNCELYRMFKINPLAFWRWGHYIFDERYRLPYKKWEEIQSVRGAIINKTGFQDF